MRRKGVLRKLVVDDTVWLWGRRHRHPDCRETLSLRRADTPHAQLRLVFRSGEGRAVAGWPLGEGEIIGLGGHWLNLNEPGVVRRLLDEAVARGLVPTGNVVREVDGWPLFDAVAGEAP
ncbi:hypothetical protein GPZ77_11220 [Streptomyces sp. QHH-9511]|uniref:hypothetical protein n=1 Tax=Streptomyces sp. QHH-9511 TaxID=2684468 RepID=UPI00131902C9|nr:hypothetical protein [Streptomyces sp. QHH-9511]QGZ48876.1 hypothetical protein GPZ77_11220 [Streptomyces sp. QHH-9511]